jgi:hypothetical protein
MICLCYYHMRYNFFQGDAFKETEDPSYSLYEFVGDLYHIVDLL